MKRILLNSALAVGSVLVFFGTFEIIVRIAGPDLQLPQAQQQFQFTQTFEFELPHHARDPQLGWRLTPGTYGPMQINASGFRGRDAAQAGPGLRIAHLGDSCTMGFTVSSDRDIYSSRLETALQQQGVAAQTFNFGVDGYSSHQGRILLAQVLQTLQPNYVTLYFGYNDHHWSNASDRNMVWGQRSGWRVAFEKSHAYRFLRRHILKAARREARLVQPTRRVAVEEFAENLRAMVAAARRAGAVPMLLTTPLRVGAPLIENEVLAELNGEPRWVTQEWWIEQQLLAHGMTTKKGGTSEYRAVLQGIIAQHPEWPLPHWLLARELQAADDNDGMRRELKLAQQYDSERAIMEQYNDAVRDVARELDVVLVDLAAEFPVRQNMFNDVVHPNAAGHARIATTLAERLLLLHGQ
jgi:lysophospholipase L1-like esterase